MSENTPPAAPSTPTAPDAETEPENEPQGDQPEPESADSPLASDVEAGTDPNPVEDQDDGAPEEQVAVNSPIGPAGPELSDEDKADPTKKYDSTVPEVKQPEDSPWNTSKDGYTGVDPVYQNAAYDVDKPIED